MASQSVIEEFEARFPTVEFDGKLGFLTPKTGISIHSTGNTFEDGLNITFVPFDILDDEYVLEIINQEDADELFTGPADGRGKGFQGEVVMKSIVDPLDEDSLLRDVFVTEKEYNDFYKKEVKDFLVRKWSNLQNRIDALIEEFTAGYSEELEELELGVQDLTEY